VWQPPSRSAPSAISWWQFLSSVLLRQAGRCRLLHENLGVELVVVDAVEQFMQALRGVVDPEQKRSIIGELFIRIFEHQARQLGSPRFLVQGTIYPDVVESSAPDRAKAQRIKTHHNVGGLPADFQFDLVEPLRYLFKDEVRLVGALGPCRFGLEAAFSWARIDGALPGR
jgi:GMP synthase (glutamine-hydrolysing)